MITVNLGEIPEEGLALTGETTRDIFQLAEAEKDVRPAGPVRYDLRLSDVGSGLLLAQGTLTAPFTLRCVACLEEFPFTLKLPTYAAEFDIPASGKLDLAERIREDLLLEIPSYPHCDRDNDDANHTCPARGKFDALKDAAVSADGDSVWDALDDLEKPGA